MQKQKVEKISIFSSLDVKLEFLTSRVKLTQFSVESSRVKLKIWATRLESSWKCEQFDSISIRVQNLNLKLDLTISLTIRNERVEREESKRTKKNESMIARVWARALVCANYRCDWLTKRYKAATLIRLHVT